MDDSSILFNILNPPVLFFFLGMIAVFLKSDLEIPHPLPKLFSIYLLLAIGFKGGYELRENGINGEIAITLIAAIFMACLIPVYTFFILKTKLDSYNSAAIAAAYGSISTVTFITASSFLERLQIDYGGHMVAALALMESPAIIVGLILVRVFAAAKERNGEFSFFRVLQEAFLNSSVFLLLGSMIIGLSSGENGLEKLKPFTHGIFEGALSFFLLDMGIVAAKRINELKKSGSFLIGFSVFIPVINAVLGILIAKLFDFSVGNALLFAILCASASYIAVPAAMGTNVPQANPSLYVSMALALTFPFNVIVGIPLYLEIIEALGL